MQYNVSYTDMYYDAYTYNANNGWRILSKKVNETNESLYDIELISTGIPAKLYYYPNSDFKNNEYNGTTVGKWAGTSAQRTAYANDFYLSRYSNDDNDYNNYNMYAAAGLYNNFEKIKFKENPASTDSSYYNYGLYKNIKGTTTGGLDGSIFRDNSLGSKITGVRSVTLADLTGKTDSSTEFTDKDGLYKLNNLQYSTNASAHGVYTYSYSTGGYWLASPYPSNYNNLRIVGYGGNVGSGGSNANGVRPVVSISGIQLTNNGGVWQIGE